MSIKISHIRIKRNGPLQEDFSFTPARFNLIYGGNETGKTYLVEAIIKMTFGDGSNSPFKNLLRQWEVGGAVRVSGLPGQEGPVSLTRSTSEGKRFANHFGGSEKTLPPDFSKLLVVRTGEPNLSEETDGVGETTLRAFLSGESLLDDIEKNIPSTIKGTAILIDRLDGHNKGPVKAWHQSRKEREKLDGLLETINQHSPGSIHLLRQAKAEKKMEIEDLYRAKQYHAATLHGQAKELDKQITLTPTEEDLADLKGKMALCRGREIERTDKTKKILDLQPSVKHQDWVAKATSLYESLVREPDTARTNRIFLLLSLASFAGLIICGLLGQNWGLAVGAILTLGFAIIHFGDRAGEVSRPLGEEQELKRLQAAYLDHFGEPLTNLASLQAQTSLLNKRCQEEQLLRGQVQDIEIEIASLKREVQSSLSRFVDGDVLESQWDAQIASLRQARRNLVEETNTILTQLATLDVPKEQFLIEDPGTEWDPSRFRDAKSEIRNLSIQIEEKEGELNQLRSEVSQNVGESITKKWEDLLSALEKKREEKAATYKNTTAEIIGMKCVYEAISKARSQENLQITENLDDPQLHDDLFSTTRRYNKLTRDEDGLLRLWDNNEEDFPLSMLSTGTKEQAMIALRVAFAEKALQGEQAFLILDDAFQHTDWERRQGIIDYTLNLALRGWQVFYFTMDDHFRDSFQDGARLKLPSDHEFVNLSTGG